VFLFAVLFRNKTALSTVENGYCKSVILFRKCI